MHFCVVGVGYVGLVTGACFAELGIAVTCVDRDQAKIELLKQGKVPFYEPGLTELTHKNVREGRLSFTTNAGRGIRESLVVFIAVGTPAAADCSADLKYIREVAVTKRVESQKTRFCFAHAGGWLGLIWTGQVASSRTHGARSMEFMIHPLP